MEMVRLAQDHPQLQSSLAAACGDFTSGGALHDRAYCACVGTFAMQHVNRWGGRQIVMTDPTNHSLAALKINGTQYRYGQGYAGLDMPVISMSARDESGQPIAGLRVRARVLEQMYTNMPQLATIVSCGLDDPISEGNRRTLAAVAEMDGQSEYVAPCITDENGEVRMKIVLLNVTTGEPTFVAGMYIHE